MRYLPNFVARIDCSYEVFSREDVEAPFDDLWREARPARKILDRTRKFGTCFGHHEAKDVWGVLAYIPLVDRVAQMASDERPWFYPLRQMLAVPRQNNTKHIEGNGSN